jgi:hypothetical protein
MQIEVTKAKVYFIYPNYSKAEDAYHRLSHLDPHICSRGGHLNAIVVDMRTVPTQGEM